MGRMKDQHQVGTASNWQNCSRKRWLLFESTCALIIAILMEIEKELLPTLQLLLIVHHQYRLLQLEVNGQLAKFLISIGSLVMLVIVLLEGAWLDLIPTAHCLQVRLEIRAFTLCYCMLTLSFSMRCSFATSLRARNGE